MKLIKGIFQLLLLESVFIFSCYSPGLALSSVNSLTALGLNPAATADFENSKTLGLNKIRLLQRQGGALVDGLRGGKALSLGPKEQIVLDVSSALTSSRGSISFWIRPHWKYDEVNSHTFFSLSWLDPRNSYSTFSKGWWEPKGAPFTYFIKNNVDGSTVLKQIRYDQGKWTHIVCAWQDGEAGYSRIYANGYLTSETKKSLNTSFVPKKFFLGNDAGVPFIATNRWADSDFDEIAFFNRPLTDSEVLQIYTAQSPTQTVLRNVSAGKIVEPRTIFDEGKGWVTQAGAGATISKVKQAGFNIYIPYVWHGSGTRYPTSIAPAEVASNFSTGDPLTRIIDLAHNNGIEVHPSITVALRQRDFLPEYYDEKTPSSAFDLHRPEFRKFIVELMVDLADRYPIDGINLDYIRTMGTCTCDYCINEYQTTFSRSLIDDLASSNTSGISLESHIKQWHENAVEDIVAEAYKRLKTIRTNLVISVDGYPRPYRNEEGRQEIAWANKGYIDIIYDMEYTHPPDYESYYYSRGRLIDPNKIVLLLSNYDWIDNKHVPLDPIKLNSYINYNKSRGGYGVAIYLLSLLSNDQIDSLAQDPFRLLAVPR